MDGVDGIRWTATQDVESCVTCPQGTLYGLYYLYGLLYGGCFHATTFNRVQCSRPDTPSSSSSPPFFPGTYKPLSFNAGWPPPKNTCEEKTSTVTGGCNRGSGLTFTPSTTEDVALCEQCGKGFYSSTINALPCVPHTVLWCYCSPPASLPEGVVTVLLPGTTTRDGECTTNHTRPIFEPIYAPCIPHGTPAPAPFGGTDGINGGGGGGQGGNQSGTAPRYVYLVYM